MENIIVYRLNDTSSIADSSANTVIKWLTDISSSINGLSGIKFPTGSPSLNINDPSGVIQVTGVDTSNATWYYYISGDIAENKKQIVSDERYLYSATNSFYATLSGSSNKSTHIKFRYGMPNDGNDPIFSENEILIKQSFIDATTIDATKIADISNSTVDSYHFASIQDGSNILMTVRDFCLRYFADPSYNNQYAKYKFSNKSILDISDLGLMIRCDTITPATSISGLQYATASSPSIFNDISYIQNMPANRCGLLLDSSAILRFNAQQQNPLYSFKFQIWNQYDLNPYTFTNNYGEEGLFSQDEYLLPVIIKTYIRPTTSSFLINPYYRFTSGIQSQSQGFTVNELWSLSGLSASRSTWGSNYAIFTQQNTDICGSTATWRVKREIWLNDVSSTRIFDISTTSLANAIERGYRTAAILQGTDNIYLDVPEGGYTSRNAPIFPSLTFRIYDGRTKIPQSYSNADISLSVRINIKPTIISPLNTEFFIISTTGAKSFQLSTKAIYDRCLTDDKNEDPLQIQITDISSKQFVKYQYKVASEVASEVEQNLNIISKLDISSNINIIATYEGDGNIYTTTNNIGSYPYIKFKFVDPYRGETDEVTAHVRIQAPPQFSLLDASSRRLRTIYGAFQSTIGSVYGDQIYSISGLLNRFFPNISDQNGSADICGIYIEDISAASTFTVKRRAGAAATSGIDISRSNLTHIERFCYFDDSIEFNYTTGTLNNETAIIGFRLFDSNIRNISDITTPGQGISCLSLQKNTLIVNSSSKPSISISGNIVNGEIPTTVYNLFENYNGIPDQNGFSVRSLALNTGISFEGIILDASCGNMFNIWPIYGELGFTEADSFNNDGIINNRNIGKWQYSKSAVNISWIDISRSGDRGLLIRSDALLRFNSDLYKTAYYRDIQPYINFRPYNGGTDITAQTGDYLLDELYWSNEYNNNVDNDELGKYSSITPNKIARIYVQIQPYLFREIYTSSPSSEYNYNLNMIDTLETQFIVDNSYPSYNIELIFEDAILRRVTPDILLNITSNISGSYIELPVILERDLNGSNIGIINIGNNGQYLRSYNRTTRYVIRRMKINLTKIKSYSIPNIVFDFSGQYRLNNTFDISYQSSLLPSPGYYNDISINLTNIGYLIQRNNYSTPFTFKKLFKEAFPSISGELGTYGIALYYEPPKYLRISDQDICGTWIIQNIAGSGSSINQTSILTSSTKYLLIGEDVNLFETVQFVFGRSPDNRELEQNFRAEMKFRLWNRKIGSNGEVFDMSYGLGERVGPGTPFSSELFTAYIDVTVNSQPILTNYTGNPNLYLRDQYEDQPDHTISGYQVSYLYDTFSTYGYISISDQDIPTNINFNMGMVITDISSKNIGTWKYSSTTLTNSGQFVDIPSLDGGKWFHLLPNDTIKFFCDKLHKNDNNNNANNYPYFNFRLWDRGNLSQITAANYLTNQLSYTDPADNYSSTEMGFRVRVIPTNDIPTGTDGATVTLTSISSANNDPSGITIQNILSSPGMNVDDKDASNNTLGIAIYGVDFTHGQWQYKLTNSDNWISLTETETYDISNAFLIGPDGSIRFRSQVGLKEVNDGLLSFRIWDCTVGISGQKYNVLQHFTDSSATQFTFDASYNQPAFSAQLFTLRQPINFVNTRPLISINETPAPDFNFIEIPFSEGGQKSIQSTEFISYINISDIDILNGQYIGLACWKIEITPDDDRLDTSPIRIYYSKNPVGSNEPEIIDLRNTQRNDISEISINNAFHFRCEPQFGGSTNLTNITITGTNSYFYGTIKMHFYSWDGYETQGLFETKDQIRLSGDIPLSTAYSENSSSVTWRVNPVQNRPEVSGVAIPYSIEFVQPDDAIDLSYIKVTDIVDYFINNCTYIERDPSDQHGISIVDISSSLLKKGSMPVGIWQYTTDYNNPVWQQLIVSPPGYKNFLKETDISAAIRFFPYTDGNQSLYDPYTYGTSRLSMHFYDGTDISNIDGILQNVESPFNIISLSGQSAYSAFTVNLNLTIIPVNHSPEFTSATTFDLGICQADTSGISISIADLFTNLSGIYIEQFDISSTFTKRGLYIHNFTKNISGEWYFSDTSGISWTAADTSYHVYELSDNIRFRFEPALYKFNTVEAAAFSVYAWDTINTIADPTIITRGSKTSYSVNSIKFTSRVSFMNHAPIIGLTAPQDGTVQFVYNIPDICEGAGPITIAGSTILSQLVLGTNYTEYDENQVLGFSIISKYDTSVNSYPSISGLGTWSYITSPGQSYVPLDPVNDGRPLIINLDASASIRYTPNANANGRTTLQFLAWDKHIISTRFNSSYVLNTVSGYDISRQGGNYSYSINRGEIRLNILPINNPAYFSNTNIVYNAGTFPRGGDLSYVSVSGLLTSFGFTDIDSSEYGIAASRSLIVADLCNNIAIGGKWLGVSGDINGPSYEIISGTVLNNTDYIFYRSAAIVPVFPPVNNRTVSIFFAPYDGGLLTDICYSRTAIVQALITNVQPTISGDPLIYDLSSFIRLTEAPKFMLSDIYNLLYTNSNLIRFPGNISSIGIALYDASNSENVFTQGRSFTESSRRNIGSVFTEKWLYKQPSDALYNTFSINKVGTNDIYTDVVYTSLDRNTIITMTTPPMLPPFPSNYSTPINRYIYCYIYDLSGDTVINSTNIQDMSYSIIIRQSIEGVIQNNDIYNSLQNVLLQTAQYTGSRNISTNITRNVNLNYEYNAVGSELNIDDGGNILNINFAQIIVPSIDVLESRIINTNDPVAPIIITLEDLFTLPP